MNGPMQEGTEGKANWESIDEDTFVCFWQYSYTGDYDVHNEPRAAPEVDIEEKTVDVDKVNIPTSTTKPELDGPLTMAGVGLLDTIRPQPTLLLSL